MRPKIEVKSENTDMPLSLRCFLFGEHAMGEKSMDQAAGTKHMGGQSNGSSPTFEETTRHGSRWTSKDLPEGNRKSGYEILDPPNIWHEVIPASRSGSATSFSYFITAQDGSCPSQTEERLSMPG